MSKNISIKKYFEIDIEDLIYSLNELSHDELFYFVKTLDLQVADWGFTERLFKYFSEEYLKYEDESGEN